MHGWSSFSVDSEDSKPIDVIFNLTHGNSDSLLEPLPKISLAGNSSAVISIIPLKAGHVDVAAWPQHPSTNIR